jgi:hypothetical protein
VKKIAAALFVSISMAVVALPASADTFTLTLTAAGPANTDNIYVYPYTFNIADDQNPLNDKTGVAMMCIDFTREVSINQSWDTSLNSIAVAAPAADVPPATVAQLDALARIYAQMTGDPGSYSISEYQFAAWSILSPSAVSGYSGFDANAQLIAKEATDDVKEGQAFDYSDYSYYDPIDTSNAQRFMVYTGSGSPNDRPSLTPTPEPSSLMLLGTGVLGIAGIARRKLVKA